MGYPDGTCPIHQTTAPLSEAQNNHHNCQFDQLVPHASLKPLSLIAIVTTQIAWSQRDCISPKD